ncbi:hypothetical protein CWATWH0003_2440b3, partial [Crocosphaera watsonii WH 0003]
AYTHPKNCEILWLTVKFQFWVNYHLSIVPFTERILVLLYWMETQVI